MNRPNIVIIKTDQQRHDTINALGYSYVITPNMDKIVNEGVSFTKAFCCGATCVASRAAFYTGLFAHNTGVYHFDQWTHIRTWLDNLKDNNYHLAGIGKTHHHPDESAKMAFHDKINAENFPMMTDWDDYSNYLKAEGQPHPFKELTKDGLWSTKCASDTFKLEEKYHVDHFIGQMATRWIQDYKEDKPFFLHVGFHGPHDPFDPPGRVLDMYNSIEVPGPVYKKNGLDDKPKQYKRFMERFYKNNSDYSVAPQYGVGNMYLGDKTDDDIKRWRKHYYAKITFIDEQIGKIMESLKERNMLNNTIIVLTSDHGENLGDHQLIYKWLMTEQTTRVPMVIRLPEKHRGGCIDDKLFTQMDIGPTILDFAQIEVPDYFDGKSNLKRLTCGDQTLAPDKVYCQDNYLTMVRTETRRMIHYAGQEYGEYYDIEKDPNEFNNLYDNKSYEEEIKTLKLEYLEWRAVSSYLGSVERTKKSCYEKRKWPQYNPNDPYFLQGWAKK
ncbi:MAG: sulfatase-like hydrolase/transferase [Spirochaetaceae bacterium]